jgi:predicted MFS family arabinose efflux permease
VTAPKTDPAEAINATAVETPAVPRAGIVMGVLLLIFFLGMSDSQMTAPLLPHIAQDFGYDQAVGKVVSLLGPAYALAAAAAALLIGPMSDKYGRRRFLLYAAIVFAISLFAAALVHNLYLLAALRMVTGLAAGTFSTCSIAYVADYFPYKRRGVAMSVVQAGYFFAFVLGLPVANLIARRASWRWSFALFGAVAILAFALVASLLPEDKHAMAEMNIATRMARRFDNIRMVFESRTRIAAIAAAFFVSGGFVGFLSLLPTWLDRVLKLSTTSINLFFVLVGIALLAGALIAGPVADKFGKRGLSILATLILAPTLILIPRLGWGAGLFTVFLISALAFAFRQGPLQALATELVPRRARGALVAVRNTASQIGIATATLASGALYDKLGFTAVGLFSGVLTLFAAACILLMHEPTGEAQAQEPNA